jgi:hypothetical protein
LQARAVPSPPDETDAVPDEDVIEPVSVFIRTDHAPDSGILDEITIFDDTAVFDNNLDITIYPTPDSPRAQTTGEKTTGEEIDDFSISSYELFLDGVSEKIKLNRFMEKTGIQNVIRRYVKGKDYYIALGAVLVWGVLLCIIGIIVIIVIGFALFG